MKSPDVSRQVASYLLEIGAVKLNVKEPFTWASGMKSPIYCDNRQILSYPHIRTRVAGLMSDLILNNFPGTEVIAGVATGAIAIGALVAENLQLPFVYVRSAAKEHGLGNQVEGKIMPGKKLVVVEDLVSTGKSSIAAVQALRLAEFDLDGMIAIFSYQLSKADQLMKENNCRLITLSSYSELLESAMSSNYISQDDLSTLKTWREDPVAWAENFK
jgi:orotate phosphoribosyltransferase